MASYLPLILRNILRNRRRTGFTMASVAVSICLVGVLFALTRALFFGGETTPGQAKRVVVHHKIALTQDLPAVYEQTIQKIPGVRAVTSLRWFGGTYKDPGDPKNRFAQFAIEPKTLFEVYPEFHISQSQREAFVSQKTACVASRALAEKLGWKPGERITLVGGMLRATLELTLAGIFDPPPSDASPVLYFNRDYLRDSLLPGDPRRDAVQQFYVETDNKDAVSEINRQIDDAFAESSYPTKSEPEEAFMLSFVSFLGNLKLFLAAISGAVTFTLLLITTNMLSMSVRERTREVGILKTLGFSDGEILGMVVGEASLIAVAGGLVGCILAGGLCTAIASAMRSAPGFVSVVRGLSFSPLVAALTVCLALLIGFVSSIAPGLYAARTSIVQTLQYNG
ncbi:MAG TPA: FtsX-like permease family protein [Terriglobales bacterium]|nr:FtsX-like permease family protein [Terriglobales bacterium]